MTTIEQIRAELAPEIERLEERMHAALATANPLLQSIVTSNLRHPGKLIRPIVLILTARLFGPVTDSVIDAACAVELLHNASLIHDDVIDTSSTRRGRPTVNAVWDNHVAVLVGDFFVSTAMQMAISTGNIRIIDALCHLGKQLSTGELDQIYNAYNHVLNEEAYHTTIACKTGALFVACARMGAIVQEAPEADVERLRDFADLMGRCFQIRDDIFDYFDDPTIGKPTGNDLREGKVTLPLIHVLGKEDLPDHARMLALVEQENLTPAQIAEVYAFARENGGIDYAFEVMSRLGREAREILQPYAPHPSHNALLRILDAIITK